MSALKNSLHDQLMSTKYHAGIFSIMSVICFLMFSTEPSLSACVAPSVAPVDTAQADFSLSSRSICINDTVFFTNNSSAFNSFLWNFGDGTTSTDTSTFHQFTATGTYVVRLVAYGTMLNDTLVDTIDVVVPPVIAAGNDTLVCIGQEVPLQASGASYFEWIGPGFTGTGDTVYVKPLVPSQYAVRGFNGGCASMPVLVSVDVDTLSPVLFSGDLSVCINDTAEVKAATLAGPVTYQWNVHGNATDTLLVAPQVDTKYAITITKGFCSRTDSVLVTVSQPPVFDITGADLPICSGEGAILAIIPSAPGYTYRWLELNDTARIVMVAPNDTTEYHVQVSSGPCTLNDTVTVVVNQAPIATLSGTELICSGDSVLLTATGGDSYLWAGGYATTNDSLRVSPASDTTFTVIAVSDNCFSVPVSFDVMVAPQPTLAGISTSPQSCAQTIQLYDDSQGAKTFYWQFHTGAESTDENVTFNYDVTGFYPVKHVINRGTGCSDSTLYYVDFGSVNENDIFIPNSFTPNNDGINEYFAVYGNVPCFYDELRIFDKWGKVIYYTDKIQTELWDGKVDGTFVPEGVYNYLLSGRKYSRHGRVMVIRGF
jgi:gliding motility-associated-like protein